MNTKIDRLLRDLGVARAEAVISVVNGTKIVNDHTLRDQVGPHINAAILPGGLGYWSDGIYHKKVSRSSLLQDPASIGRVRKVMESR